MKIVFWKSSNGRKPVQEYIDSCTPKEQDKIIRQVYLLEEHGYLAMSKQGDFEKIDDVGVWEFKIDYRNLRFRIFCGLEKGMYVLLHIVRKTYKKLKRRDIKLAVDRLLEYRKREQ